MHNLPNAGGPFGLPALLCMSSELAALKFQLAMVKFKLALERHYSRDQPRAQLGTPIGGQWIGPGEVAPSQRPVRLAQAESEEEIAGRPIVRDRLISEILDLSTHRLHGSRAQHG